MGDNLASVELGGGRGRHRLVRRRLPHVRCAEHRRDQVLGRRQLGQAGLRPHRQRRRRCQRDGRPPSHRRPRHGRERDGRLGRLGAHVRAALNQRDQVLGLERPRPARARPHGHARRRGRRDGRQPCDGRSRHGSNGCRSVRRWGGEAPGRTTPNGLGSTTDTQTSSYGLTFNGNAGDNGRGHTCVVFDDGELKCWGSGAFGQLGHGNTEHLGDEPGEMGDNLHPVDLGSGVRVSLVSASWLSTCAVLANAGGEVLGLQLGWQARLRQHGEHRRRGGPDGRPPAACRPRQRSGGHRRDRGYGHTCAVLVGGASKCWGEHYADGKVGYGRTVADTQILGDQDGEMGDSLPYVELGSGMSLHVCPGPPPSSPPSPAADTAAVPTRHARRFLRRPRRLRRLHHPHRRRRSLRSCHRSLLRRRPTTPDRAWPEWWPSDWFTPAQCSSRTSCNAGAEGLRASSEVATPATLAWGHVRRRTAPARAARWATTSRLSSSAPA